MKYVRAEREADWPLHLASVHEMMPLLFAASHFNYARYGFYYLREMEAMAEIVRQHFVKGEHIMHHNAGLFNGIWSDMAIETTFMRYGHGQSGIIGITLRNIEDLGVQLACMQHSGQQSGSEEDTGTARTGIPNASQRGGEGQSQPLTQRTGRHFETNWRCG